MMAWYIPSTAAAPAIASESSRFTPRRARQSRVPVSGFVRHAWTVSNAVRDRKSVV